MTGFEHKPVYTKSIILIAKMCIVLEGLQSPFSNTSVDPLNNPMRWVLLFPILQEETEATERLSDLNRGY